MKRASGEMKACRTCGLGYEKGVKDGKKLDACPDDFCPSRNFPVHASRAAELQSGQEYPWGQEGSGMSGRRPDKQYLGLR